MNEDPLRDDHFQQIYAHKAAQYDRMVSREDYQDNLIKTLTAIRPLSGADVVEFGAGTGRVTRLLAPHVRSIRAFDASQSMLDVAAATLRQTGTTNWTVAIGDNRALPIEDACADIAIEGWSFAHMVGWYPETWRDEVSKALAEMGRVLRPGGVAILIETMGTGNEAPKPPHDGLVELYRFWEGEHGLSGQNIRTDYRFASVEEADELTRFFFGDELADRIVREDLTILPECTGIWSKTFPA